MNLIKSIDFDELNTVKSLIQRYDPGQTRFVFDGYEAIKTGDGRWNCSITIYDRGEPYRDKLVFDRLTTTAFPVKTMDPAPVSIFELERQGWRAAMWSQAKEFVRGVTAVPSPAQSPAGLRGEPEGG